MERGGTCLGEVEAGRPRKELELPRVGGSSQPICLSSGDSREPGTSRSRSGTKIRSDGLGALSAASGGPTDSVTLPAASAAPGALCTTALPDATDSVGSFASAVAPAASAAQFGPSASDSAGKRGGRLLIRIGMATSSFMAS